MNEKLPADYIKDNELNKWDEFDLEDITLQSGLVVFDETPNDWDFYHHSIPLLDIMAWVWDKVNKENG